jgi:hypothetical protein
VAAADVGDAGSGLEPLDHPYGGEPRADEVGGVPRQEEPLATVVDVGVVLVPAHPGPAARRVDDV